MANQSERKTRPSKLSVRYRSSLLTSARTWTRHESTGLFRTRCSRSSSIYINTKNKYDSGNREQGDCIALFTCLSAIWVPSLLQAAPGVAGFECYSHHVNSELRTFPECLFPRRIKSKPSAFCSGPYAFGIVAWAEGTRFTDGATQASQLGIFLNKLLRRLSGTQRFESNYSDWPHPSFTLWACLVSVRWKSA